MKKCDCYHERIKYEYTYDRYSGQPIRHEVNTGVCYGTFECEECKCGGDKSECDFYEDVRAEANDTK